MCHITVNFPACLRADEIPQLKAEDVAHFVATFNRALLFADNARAKSVTIYCTDRTQPRYSDQNGERVFYDHGGWLEHGVIVEWVEGGRFVMGAIQRTVGAPSEFHS